MKHMKRFIALFAALALMLTMAVPALAATITIDGKGASYSAYKLLNATVSGTGEDQKISYTINSKYENILKTVTAKTAEKEIIKYIEGLNATQIETFAESVYNKIKADTTLTADVTSSGETGSHKTLNVDKGYYLIVETATEGDDDTFSLLMLDTSKGENKTIKSKEDTPKLEKKIKETNDSTGTTNDWQDAADYDIGDVIPFKLTGTVSQKYDDYNQYKYIFHDKMSAGLSFNSNSVKVYVGETELTASDYTVVTTGLEDNCTFEVQFTDLKTITGATVTKDSKITVEYTATLNSNAVIGSTGNPNTAYLEYENNPYAEGNGRTTGTTPEDKVIAFTYKLVANKVDKDNQALNGAGFTLYKYVENSSTAVDGWETVATYAPEEGKVITTFTFTGVDAGRYKLVETTVPDGYTQADDLEFYVAATYDITSDNPTLKTLTITDANGIELMNGETKVFTTNLANGSAETSIVNKTGMTLPSTGGIGTTLFYVVGGGLMVAAAVLLITKKRMENK